MFSPIPALLTIPYSFLSPESLVFTAATAFATESSLLVPKEKKSTKLVQDGVLAIASLILFAASYEL